MAIAQAANDLLTIQNVEASFVAVQVGNGVNISARSLGAVNVQVIMESLGGGGHQTMAAAQLKHITPRQPGHAFRPPLTSTVRARRSRSPKMNLNPEKGEAGMNHYDYLIVGAGLYGAVFAQQAKRRAKHALSLISAATLPGISTPRKWRAFRSTAMGPTSSTPAARQCGSM